MNNPDIIWNTALESLIKYISNDEINKWLRPVVIKELKDNIITLGVQNRFFKTWIEDNYIDVIKKALSDILINVQDIKVIINKKEEIKSEPQGKPNVSKVTEQKPKKEFSLPLDPMMTFENFISGPSNEFAYSTCLYAAKGIDYNLHNPLFIYGDAGLGKTHLMQAIGNKLVENFPKLNVLYITGDNFMTYYVNAMRAHKGEEFDMMYQNADVLLFDDIQLLSPENRPKTYEQFFTTYNVLYAKGKKIIITSNVPPNKLPSLNSRLLSRFQGGLMVDITFPSTEEREAIISKKCELLKMGIKREIISYLAENIKAQDTRSLLGAIYRLYSKYVYEKKEINIDYIRENLDDFLNRKDRPISPEEIIEITANFFHLKSSDLKSKTRKKDIALPRSIAMYIISVKTNLSLTSIGELFNRDHTTVLAAVKKIKSGIESSDLKYSELKEAIDYISENIEKSK